MGVVHIVEEGGLVVGGGVVFSRVVLYLVVENDYVSVEAEIGIGGTGRVLVRTVIRGSWR